MEAHLIFKNKNCAIKHIPELNSSWVEFYGLVNHEGYKFVMEKVHDLIIERNLTHWISNLVDMKLILPENQRWTNEYYIPKILKNTDIVKVAVIVGKDIFMHASLTKIRDEVVRANMPIRYFDNFEDIKVWFKDSEVLH